MIEVARGNISKFAPSIPNTALRQGEIITSLSVNRISLETLFAEEGEYEVIPELQPYAIVVSQDCDLDWDFKARQPENENDKKQRHKLMPYVFFCMLQAATSLRDRDKDIPKDKDMNSETWNQVKTNKHERYHFFEAVKPEQDALGIGLPETTADFKKYFTIPTDELYAKLKKDMAQRHCRLTSPYLEHFSTRFCYYQFRVALPEDHFSEPNTRA